MNTLIEISLLLGLLLGHALAARSPAFRNIEKEFSKSNRESRSYNNYNYQNDYTSLYSPNYYTNQPPNCKRPPGCLDPHTFPNLTDAQSQGVSSRTYYISMSTCWGYTKLATALLGRSPTSVTELTQMCPTIIYGGINHAQLGGYGNQIVQNCPNDINVCTPNPELSDAGTNPSLQGSSETDFLIDTIPGKYALWYRCVDNLYSDVRACVTHPSISESLKRRIYGKLKEIGFPVENILAMQCPCSSPKANYY